ncbi:hypothetical protein IQ254_19345 [Nodosilinea sp. LEGE 07088]|uniref:hypothetical protein n=1 Tax=Nodosilinea sp. LEGE 07088 TaxID=2777968 RepID=UPI00187FEEB5|nr:hypothetical protein [Nodosilinea sp. LEGE 07088]MBE9139326.1 hypothetical protein [Nodosilinea sp. LEGE 07088]
MSQEEALSTATLSPEEPTPVDSEALVSTYADSLITELFDDVDKILDGDDNALAAAEAPPEPASTAIAPIVETVATPANSETAETSLTALGNEIDFFSGDHSQPAPAPAKTRFGKLFDRLLLAITALSLIGVGGLLWLGQQGRSPNADTLGQQSDEEFLAYLQRSLEVIYDKVESGELGNTATASQLPPGSATPTPPMLPPLGAGGTVGSLGTGPVNVIERVYIPYQTSQQPTAGAQGLVPQPGVRAASPVVPTAPPQTSAATANPAHTLVGILELGDRSAALFEINGVSQRVYIGERIGSSGWSLVSVSNEEAVVRRNGEVRSIFIGQKF